MATPDGVCVSRREFLERGGVAAAGVLALSAVPGCLDAAEAEDAGADPLSVAAGALSVQPIAGRSRHRFDAWLGAVGIARDAGVDGLVYNFYDTAADASRWIFPLLSGKHVLWLLAQGRVVDAERAADAVLAHQQLDASGALARSHGAFPSLITWDDAAGAWVDGDSFYAGDALCLTEALLALYAATGTARYLEAATAAGRWVVDVMCRGQDYGLWVEDHGAPMHFVTAAGAFDNAIHAHLECLWLPALTRLSAATGDPRFGAQAARAYAFYLTGKQPGGPFMDHYAPGWPPVPFDPARWKPFAPATAVNPSQLVADNVLRAGLGAWRMGDLAAASDILDWLRPEDGALPGYLDALTGAAAFIPGDPVYYDVVSSGLLRALAARLGRTTEARAARRFLRRAQSDDGGWYWGLRRDDGAPIAPDQAAIIGFWATAELI